VDAYNEEKLEEEEEGRRKVVCSFPVEKKLILLLM
jgi:hypothetical protein